MLNSKKRERIRLRIVGVRASGVAISVSTSCNAASGGTVVDITDFWQHYSLGDSGDV